MTTRRARTVLRDICAVILLVIGLLNPLVAEAQVPSDAAIVDLIAAGRTDDAAALLETTNPSAADRQFFQGRVLKAEGQFDAAIAQFRDILQGEPGYLNARRELAHTLLLNGEFAAAEFHFRTLLRIDTDDALREGYWQFLDIIARERPFGLSAQFALIPSTNVNRGSARAIFDPKNPNIPPLRITSQGEAGVGLLLGVSGFYRAPLGPRTRWTFDWGLQGRKYQDHTHDTATNSLRLGLDHRLTRTRLTFGTFSRATWRQDEDHNLALGVDAGIERSVGQRTTLFANTLTEARRYPNASQSNGPFYASQLGLSYALRPDLRLTLGASFDASRPESRHQAYDGYALFGRASKSWGGGLQTVLGLEAGLRDYKEDFPLTTFRREDEFYRIDATLRASRWSIRGFMPTTTCSYTRNISNVAFYDYDVAECRASFVRRY
ncbi:MAG: surface lipoprotein assembly modifier [Pseudomonadota bacterium]